MTRATERMTRYVDGVDLGVGDVIDYSAEGFTVVRFGPYDSPLIPITGPGRIAYNHRGEGFAVYDQSPVRVLAAALPVSAVTPK